MFSFLRTSSPLSQLGSAIQTFFEEAAAAAAGIFSNVAARLRTSVRITASYPMKVARQKNVSKHIKSVGETRRGRREEEEEKEKKRGAIRFENNSDCNLL